VKYLRDWLLDSVITHDENWQRCVAESNSRVAAGKAGDPVDAEELRRMVLSVV
jgi:hypothetical protein